MTDSSGSPGHEPGVSVADRCFEAMQRLAADQRAARLNRTTNVSSQEQSENGRSIMFAVDYQPSTDILRGAKEIGFWLFGSKERWAWRKVFELASGDYAEEMGFFRFKNSRKGNGRVCLSKLAFLAWLAGGGKRPK